MLGRVKRGAFDLHLEGLTSFGGRKPRAVVAAVAQERALLDVQAEHERLMQRIGLEPEGRKYTPHVTLARLRDTGFFSHPQLHRRTLRPVFFACLGRRRALCGRSQLSAALALLHCSISRHGLGSALYLMLFQ
jgi:2'-5' RNA ligase superfamily protein